MMNISEEHQEELFSVCLVVQLIANHSRVIDDPDLIDSMANNFSAIAKMTGNILDKIKEAQSHD